MRAEKSLPSAQRIALNTVPFHSIPIRLKLLVYSGPSLTEICVGHSIGMIIFSWNTQRGITNDNNDTDI